MTARGKQRLLWVLVFIIVFNVVFGFFATRNLGVSRNVGCQVVKLMYEFDDPLYLGPNYARLKEILSDSMWDKLNIDNDQRVVNSYYKFLNESSSVDFVFVRDGFIVYRLHNDNIAEGTLWVFCYDIVDGKVDNIREYKLVSVYRGVEGGF